jgi:hypothetical protein
MPEAAANPAPRALDGAAAADDAGLGRNPMSLHLRYVVQERLRRLFPRGARVLDLGRGTGDDALFLASLGVDVHAMGGVDDRGSVEGSFDGAFSTLGPEGGAALPAVGRALASRLRPGAPVAFCVIGPRPIPRLVHEALTGHPAPSPEEGMAGRRLAAHGLSSRDLREGLGPGFSWRSCTALGVLVPAPVHEDWARGNPMAYGLLAAAERLVRDWPVVRECGAHLLLEGKRD